jgi:hypothetical protein
MGISALSIPAGCSQDPALSRANAIPVVALHESTSFIDHGLKAIVFPEGVAFVMRPDLSMAAEQDYFKMYKVTLPHEDHQSLLAAFDQHRFFVLPRDMKAKVTDGSSVFVLYADATREHRVYSYESPNRDFLAVKDALKDGISKSAAAAESISALEFLEGIAAEMENLPKDSPPRNTAAMWLDLLVRGGPPSFREVKDTTRFTLPGDGAVLFRDVRFEFAP